VESKLDVLDWGPPPYERAPKYIRSNLFFIPALALNAKTSGISFFTYNLIEKEYWKVRPAVDWAKRDIRHLFGAIELLCPFNTDGVLLAWDDPTCFDRYLNSLPARIKDQKFSKLLQTMGAECSRDCVHVWVSDHHELDGFLSMDKAFVGKYNQCRKTLGFNTIALSPRDVCHRYGISPIGPEWFTARADPHTFYEPHRPIPVGEYIYTNDDSERLFSTMAG